MQQLVEWVRQQPPMIHSTLSIVALAYSVVVMPVVWALVDGSRAQWKRIASPPKRNERLAPLIAVAMAIPCWIAGPIYLYTMIIHSTPKPVYSSGILISAVASGVLVWMAIRQRYAPGR